MAHGTERGGVPPGNEPPRPGQPRVPAPRRSTTAARTRAAVATTAATRKRELIPAGRGRHGLVTRTVHPTVPPKVEYALTPAARELHESLQQLTDWAERNRLYIAEARAAYDTEHCPEPVDA
ncbi:winged helix-turn-helix transcriptional regulator [Streptomyces sp. NPDC057375]|uniref:winged helix-turn-helix transcriptional regulator n=1 Tax=Streptomyces sp. NPDC057375 TaxID=3346109 RepID=UPI00363292E2